MTLKTNLAGLLQTMRDEHLAFAGYLSEFDRVENGTAENWSARDMLVHNVVWAGRTLDDLQRIARGAAPHDHGDEDAANAAIFAEHHGASWETVQAMITETYAAIDAYLADLDDEALTAVPAGLSEPTWREIAGSYISHPLVHLWSYLHAHGYPDILEARFGEQFAGRLFALSDDNEWRGNATYNLACQYAIAGRSAEAITTLAEALRLNPGLRDWSTRDTDLDSLRADPAYQALYA